MVRAAVWQIAIGLMATAWLGGALPAAELAPDGAPAVAPEGTSDDSTVEPAAAAVPEEPPAPEAMPREEPGSENVPPGEITAGEPEQTADGTPLPGVEQVLEEGQPCTPVISSNCWFAPDHWYVNSDFVVINHQKSKQNTRFAFDALTGEFFSEQNLTLGITEGARLTLGLWRCHDTYGWDHAVEFSFNGLEDWHHRFEIVGFLPLSIVTVTTFGRFDQFQFGAADAALVYYKSQFNSGGVDLRWTKRPGKDALVYDPDGFWKRAAEDGYVFTFLLGIHDTELDERFTYAARRSGVSPTVFGLDYSNRTTNNLLGLHVGSELDYKHDLWYVGIRGGSTICANFAEVDTAFTFNDPVSGSGSHHENGFHTGPGAVSDLSMLAGWQIRPNMRVHASYDFLWLTSIAPAPAQVRFGGFQPNAINVARDMMFTGVSLGLEINW